MKRLVLVIGLAVAGGAAAQETAQDASQDTGQETAQDAGTASAPRLFTVTGVADGQTVNIRAGASTDARAIGTLVADGNPVEVIAIRDNWGRINGPQGPGWVYMDFLAPVAGEAWWTLAAPLTCASADPAWTMVIDAARLMLRQSGPAGEDPPLPMQFWPGTAARPLTAIRFGSGETAGGFAVISPRDCALPGDARAYGLAASVFRSTPEGRPDLPSRSGCCTLLP